MKGMIIIANIIIDIEKCTKCNICFELCPVKIIEKANEADFPKINEKNENNCMFCGHCEAFCSQSALILNFNVEEKIDCKQEELSIAPKNLALYIKNRRSIRNIHPRRFLMK